VTDAAKPADAMAALTPQQARFVREYLGDLNATQAAIRAGYSARTADVQGPRLLGNARVAAAVAAGQKRIADRLEISAEKVLSEMAKIAFSNMQDYVSTDGEGGAFVDLSGVDRDKWAAVQEITVDEYTEGRGEAARELKRTKFKLADKRGALVDLGKRLSLWNGRTIVLDLPSIASAEDVSLALGRVVEAVAGGSITPDEGQALASILETRRRSLESIDYERRIAALEARHA